jgi:hypothetical protein
VEAHTAYRASANGDQGLEGVVQKFLLWPAGLISVCFFDGELNARTQVAALSANWTDGSSVSLDFGGSTFKECSNNQASDIRITFSGKGSWAEVGTKARFIPQECPTLQLGGMGNIGTFSGSQRRSILHELGHALGFEHEHQGPSSECDEEFDWDYLYAILPWRKDEVKRNFRSLLDDSRMSGLLTTEFDPHSVMTYVLPKEAFLKREESKCYVEHKEETLSVMDKQTILSVYKR